VGDAVAPADALGVAERPAVGAPGEVAAAPPGASGVMPCAAVDEPAPPGRAADGVGEWPRRVVA